MDELRDLLQRELAQNRSVSFSPPRAIPSQATSLLSIFSQSRMEALAMNSGIEVFFTEVNKPWSNADPGTYYVNVFSPDGIEMIGVSAPNGYVRIDLPPGRYLIVGTMRGKYVNFDSNETLVNVGCGQRPCVTIIPRSLHFCVWWLTAAMQMIADEPDLAPAVAKMAPKAAELLQSIEAAIPKEHRQLDFLPAALDPIRKKVRKKK